MKKIENWNSVPDGGIVVEDTYAEVYEMFTVPRNLEKPTH